MEEFISGISLHSFIIAFSAIVICAVGVFLFKRKRRIFIQRKDAIIVGTSNSTMKFASDIISMRGSVKIISEEKNNPQLSKLQDLGVKIQFRNGLGIADFNQNYLTKCSLLVLSSETDAQNINILDHVFKTYAGSNEDYLTILVKINQEETRSLLLDYASNYALGRKIYLHIFNPQIEFAKTIYDRFPPHLFVSDETVRNNRRTIVVCGYNSIAEYFLLENCVLSNFNSQEKLKVIHIASNITKITQSLDFKWSHLQDYIDYVPIEMSNKSFVGIENWSENFFNDVLSMDVAYCFGDEDGEVLNMALRFKQQMYNAIRNVRSVPVIACLPETSDLFKILGDANKQQKSVLDILNSSLRVHTVKMYSDGIQIEKYLSNNDAIENIAKVVNYYYSVSYEFSGLLNKHFKKNNANQLISELKDKILNFTVGKHSPLSQIESMVIASLLTFTKGSTYNLKTIFGIEERWKSIPERSRESNRYVARDITSKAKELENNGVHKFDAATITDYAHLLSESIHKRWAAEKQNANFIYGKMENTDPIFKHTLKTQLKIHDMLIPYDELPEIEKNKDVDMLKLLPLLVNLQKVYSSN